MAQQLNLFNPVFLRQKKYFSAATMVQLLAVVAVASLATYALLRVQLAGLEQQLAAADTQFADVRDQLQKFGVEAKRTPSRALEDEVARLEAELAGRRALAEALDGDALGDPSGFSRYLTALARQHVPGVWVTRFGAEGGEGPLVIQGRMLRPELLPTYLRSLGKEDVLRGRTFSELNMMAREEKPATPGAGEAASPGPRQYTEFVLGTPKALREGAR